MAQFGFVFRIHLVVIRQGRIQKRFLEGAISKNHVRVAYTFALSNYSRSTRSLTVLRNMIQNLKLDCGRCCKFSVNPNLNLFMSD